MARTKQARTITEEINYYYNKYEKLYKKQNKLYGQRAIKEYVEFAQGYMDFLESQQAGYKTTPESFTKELARGAIVFDHVEAQRIAGAMVQLLNEEQIRSMGFNTDISEYRTSSNSKHNADKLNLVTILTRQIQQLTPSEAQELVANNIDFNVFVNGDDFEFYTY